jgi:molybdopterin-guanine dinucleotide biosynthesis protein A
MSTAAFWGGVHACYHHLMELRAGFILAGGHSRRMGRDKALLPMEGMSLVERTARLVRAAAGSVIVIGAPARYEALSLPVAADLVAEAGPIGGLYTALEITQADWNLVVACDMPGLTEDFLRRLIAAAQASGAVCLVPETAAGLHPLCAVYHRSVRAAVDAAITHKHFKMHDLLRDIEAVAWPVADASLLENVNTPLEWGAR